MKKLSMKYLCLGFAPFYVFVGCVRWGLRMYVQSLEYSSSFNPGIDPGFLHSNNSNNLL